MENIKISLGKNCDPRIHLKEKFNLSKNNGYKSSLFDLCITPYESLCSVLETNFKYFFDDLKIISWENAPGNRKLAGNGLTCITNKYGMIFNHEGSCHSHLFQKGRNDDEFYTKNNFKEFKKRYVSRISNFVNYCKQSKKIIFIHNHKKFDENLIKNIIINNYGKKNIEFITI